MDYIIKQKGFAQPDNPKGYEDEEYLSIRELPFRELSLREKKELIYGRNDIDEMMEYFYQEELNEDGFVWFPNIQKSFTDYLDYLMEVNGK